MLSRPGLSIDPWGAPAGTPPLTDTCTLASVKQSCTFLPFVTSHTGTEIVEKEVAVCVSGLPPCVPWGPDQAELRTSETTAEQMAVYAHAFWLLWVFFTGIFQPAGQAKLALGMEPPEAC